MQWRAGEKRGTGRRARGGLAALSVAWALAPLAPVAAQQLEAAQNFAFDQSYVLRSDKARQDGAEARLRGTIDAFLPSIALVGSKPLDSKIKYHPDLPIFDAGVDSTPRYRPNQYGITVDLPLFDGFQRWNSLLSARTLAEAGRLITHDVRQQLLFETAAAYLAVIRDRKVLGHRQRQLQSIETIRRGVEAQVAVNDATLTDSALADSRVADASAGVELAIADLKASEIDFTRITGIPATRLSPPRLPPLPRSEAELADIVRAESPRLAAARLETQAAGQLADAAKGALLPQLSLQFTHGRQTDITPTLRSIRETTTQVQARIPLHEPGAYPRIAEASAFAQQKFYDTEDAILRTVTSARTVFQRRAAYQAQVATLARRVAALRGAVHGYEIERGAGFRTVIDELNSRSELAIAEILLATGEAERDRLAFALAAAMGRLGSPAPGLVAGPIALLAPPPGDPFTTGSLAPAITGKPTARDTTGKGAALPRRPSGERPALSLPPSMGGPVRADVGKPGPATMATAKSVPEKPAPAKSGVVRGGRAEPIGLRTDARDKG
ncbi:TolC family protein [Methylobacterium sp. Leaf466]|uniref:TolC family protein n=1 Tax=Methylobacterium sp. Leaf466 TaxID=1736386 RepID=UPI0006FB784C|nr:TolC family protein [Methylobacterium sp. Leaf466]KQT78851.1 hypothetical protein ASG59_06645 [Methylobacterium sp. Leaf466]